MSLTDKQGNPKEGIQDEPVKPDASAAGSGIEAAEQTAAAKRAFLAEVQAIEGIVAVHDTADSTVIRVSVPEPLGDVANRVYDLDDAVRARYPESRLDVWVSAVP